MANDNLNIQLQEINKLPKTEDDTQLFVVASQEINGNKAVTYPLKNLAKVSYVEKLEKKVKKIEDTNTNDKGYFSSETKLFTDYPTPTPGNYANVAGIMYECKNKGSWTDTGIAAPIPELDLSGYAKINTESGDVIRTGELAKSKGQSEVLPISQKTFTDSIDKVESSIESVESVVFEDTQKQIKYDVNNVTVVSGKYWSASDTRITSANWNSGDAIEIPVGTVIIYKGGLYGLTAGIIVKNINGTIVDFITAGGATTFKNTLTFTMPQGATHIKPSWLVVNTFGTPLPFSIEFYLPDKKVVVAKKEELNVVSANVNTVKESVETKLVRPAKDGQTINYKYTDFAWADGAYDANGNIVGAGRWKHATAGKSILGGAKTTFKGAWLGQTAGIRVTNAAGVQVQFITSPNVGTVSPNDVVTEIVADIHPDGTNFRPSIYTYSGINNFEAEITTTVEEKYFVAKNEELDAIIGFFIKNISSRYTYKGRVNVYSKTPLIKSINDTYFAVEAGVVFGILNVLVGDIIYWDGTTWQKKTYRLNLAEGGGGSIIPSNTDYDVIVIGGGAGGVSSAYALLNKGLRVLLIEKDSQLGGTHLNAWVNVYATTPPPPFLKPVVENLLSTGKARYIDKDYEEFTTTELSSITYDNTYLREEFTGKPEANIVLDPGGTAAKYLADITGGGITVMLNTEMIGVNHDSGVVKSITYRKNGAETTVTSKFFIDCTADNNLIAKTGLEMLTGEEATNRFLAEYGFIEARGTTNSSTVVNAPTMMYRTVVGAEDLSGITASFANDAGAYYSADKSQIFFNTVGYLNVSGYQVVRDGESAVRLLMDPLTIKHWKTIKNGNSARFAMLNLPSRKFEANAPKLGVRETYRIKAERLLNENSLYTQISVSNIKNGHNLDKKIACSNHIIDIHGTSNLTTANKNAINAVRRPYGVPYGSLIPKGLKNVFVASRGAGMTHLAASSCRLIKDVMQFGWASGHAARICVNNNFTNVRDVNVEELQGADYTDFENSVTKIVSLIK